MNKNILTGALLLVVALLVHTVPVHAEAETVTSTSTLATSTSSSATTTGLVATNTSSAATSPEAISSPVKQTPAQIEKRVREYFADIPVMIDIARCESKFRQFTDSGNILRGGSGGMMVGIFQFFESIHTKTAKNLGFDLQTVEGNLGYARHLYSQSGSAPWVSCVPAVVSTPDSGSPTPSVQLSAKNEKLKIELLKQVIVLLQELLKLRLAK